MRVARQGFRYLALSLALAAAFSFIAPVRWLAWLFLALGAFVLFFFRDPSRTPPADPNLLVSPADGRVVEVGADPSAPERRQVSIFLSIFDVHINRSPLTAVVEKVQYKPGEFLAAYRKDAAARNERNEIDLRDGEYRVTVRQIAGVVARRIICDVAPSDRLEKGQRFGLIQFGSRTELSVPGDTEILVRVGERVRGGETAIGRRS